jgi:hypothetical protein
MRHRFQPMSWFGVFCIGFGFFESEAWIPDTLRSLSLAHEVGNPGLGLEEIKADEEWVASGRLANAAKSAMGR